MEGQNAPDFSLKDQHDATISLSSFRGSPVVLYFYPKDDTPGCTKEACAFRDARLDYAKAGAKIVGISPDSVASHAKFARKFELDFTLLSDPQTETCQAYGVWKEKNMYGRKYMGVERTTFVIDKEGKIAQVFSKVRVDGHADEVIREIQSMI